MQLLRHIMIKIMNVDPVLVINQPDVDILEPLSDARLLEVKNN